MASYHIQYQLLHETLFNHLCEVNSGVNIPPGTRKLKGDELDVSVPLNLAVGIVASAYIGAVRIVARNKREKTPFCSLSFVEKWIT